MSKDKYKLTVTRSGIGIKPEKLKEKIISEDEIPKWFGNDDFVMKRLKEYGVYGNTIGQHLYGKVERLKEKMGDMI